MEAVEAVVLWRKSHSGGAGWRGRRGRRQRRVRPSILQRTWRREGMSKYNRISLVRLELKLLNFFLLLCDVSVIGIRNRGLQLKERETLLFIFIF